MNFWLAKSDPDNYGWSDLVREGKTSWDGVRNYKARNYIRAMKPGDQVLLYHSGVEKAVVGAMTIQSAAYTDPTAQEEIWSTIEVAPAWLLKNPVPLARIKDEPSLRGIHLVRVSRLSVMPLEKEQFQRIVSMGGGKSSLA